MPNFLINISLPIFFVSLFFFSCKNYSDTENLPQGLPDISARSEKAVVLHFEQLLFAADTVAADSAVARLRREAPEFSEAFFGVMLPTNQLADLRDTVVRRRAEAQFLRGFLNNKPTRHLFDTVQIVFGNFSAQQSELDQAVRYYAHHFPDAPLPRFTTFISEFSLATALYGENDVALGLDMFLGDQFPYAA